MSRKKISSQKIEPKKKTRDFLKWVLIFLLIVVGICANLYFSQLAWVIRSAIGIVLAVIIIAIVAMTEKGRLGWAFIKGSRIELRKVVWPTRRETTQTTVLVIIMVIIVALILWGLDAFFFWIVKSLSA